MYGKKDAIIALVFFAYFMIRNFAIFIIDSRFHVSSEQWQIAHIINAIMDTLIVLTIVKMRKQNLASIGLHKRNIWAAIGFGLLFAPIFIFQRIMQGVVVGWELYSFAPFMLSLMTVVLFAVREDINFVGFIQTRLYGLVKNDAWAINLGAALFTLAHIPARFVHDISMGVPTYILLLANWFFMHRAFVLLFKKYNSLVPVFIMHIASNFPRIWQGEGTIAWFWLAIPTAVFCVAVETWHWRWSENTNRGDCEQKKETQHG